MLYFGSNFFYLFILYLLKCAFYKKFSDSVSNHKLQHSNDIFQNYLDSTMFDCVSGFPLVQVEFSFPPLGDSKNNTLPSEWRFLPFLALPDGAHNCEQGTTN